MANVTLPPIPLENIGESFNWRDWLTQVQRAVVSNTGGGGGSSGVSSFNTRTGAVLLNSTDISYALGYTPASTSVFSSTINGLTPLSGGGTTKYLRADGTWQVISTTPPSYVLAFAAAHG
jgi:hypothetical protein